MATQNIETQKGATSKDRDLFVEKLKTQIDKGNRQIDKWEVQMRLKKAEARREAAEEIEELRERMQTAQERLDELQKASEAAWKDVKAGAEKARDELRRSIETARTHFSRGGAET